MSRFDDRLTKELERAARPPEPADVFDEIDRRRERRVTVRRMQTAMLATVVFAGSIGGVLVLNRGFRGEGATTPALPPAENGPIVVYFGDADSQHLYLQDPGDPEWDPRAHQLTDSPNTYDGQPAVSPDGRTVVFVRYDPADLSTSIWSVGIDGTDAHRIFSSEAFGYGPAFSPDGATIALTKNRRGTDDGGILLMAPDGSDVREVTDTDSTMQGVAWSPDGSRLAFESGPLGGPYTVGLMNLDGTGRVELPGTDSLNTSPTPAWSPDGRRLAFVRDLNVWVYDLEDQTARQITTFPGTEHGDMSPTWSPDGRLIAFERYVGPYERFLYVIEPDGSALRRIGPGAGPAWSVALPDPSTPSPTDASEPTDTQTPEPGQNIGLAFDLCRVQALDGIDFLGDGVNGTAWVGTRLDGGSCPPEFDGETVVAVDVDGDGSAESWAGPLARCVGCSPFAVTDLNGDGILELVVTVQYSAVTEYTLFSLQNHWGAGPPQLQQVTVAEPGSPPDFRAGKPVSFWAGGDEGFTASIRCENYPADPVLIVTTGDHPIEGPGSETRTVVSTRLVLGTDGMISVVGTDRFTEPSSTDPSAASFTRRACGMSFWPA